MGNTLTAKLLSMRNTYKSIKIMKEIEERVRQIIVDKLGVEESEVTQDTNLVDDLGADSLDTIELIMEFEKTFDVKISDDVTEGIKTVGDMINAIAQFKNEK